MPAVVVLARRRATRSPLAPSTRNPSRAIAAAWSAHTVTPNTSCPADAISPAYTDPMAPHPTTATRDMAPPSL